MSSASIQQPFAVEVGRVDAVEWSPIRGFECETLLDGLLCHVRHVAG